MPNNTDALEGIAELRRTFYIIQQKAKEHSKAHTMFSDALENSKYRGIELPDEVVDCVDYAFRPMTFDQFIKFMDRELKEKQKLEA